MGIIITTASLETSGSCQGGPEYFQNIFNVEGQPWYSGSANWCYLEPNVAYTYSGSLNDYNLMEWAAINFKVKCIFYNTDNGVTTILG
tara:strand:+ start:587 stop:850 length:264 start_codon:yes stop_codon:yes gene_type:complete